jgi:nucleotide-binding universal stress UspA family protein
VAAVELDAATGLPLDADVLTTAATLAQAEGARLVAVHAWTPIGESIITCPERGLGPLGGRRVLRRARRDREELLGRLIEAVQTPPDVTSTVVKGPVAEALRSVLNQTGADTLVLGYRGRSGVWGAVRGNLADSFGSIPGLAVLAVRPGHPVVSSPTLDSIEADPAHARA